MTVPVLDLPLIIPFIATGYIATIYLLIFLMQRMEQFRRP